MIIYISYQSLNLITKNFLSDHDIPRLIKQHIMKPILSRSTISLRLLAPPRTAFPHRCLLHTSPPKPAAIGPITVHGPPPSAPVPSIEHVDIRVARKRKQADLLKRGQDLKSGKAGNAAKTKRFWKDVHVRKVDGMLYNALPHFP